MQLLFQQDYSNAHLVHITIPIYAPLFFRLFINHLKKNINNQIQYYNLSDEIPHLLAELSTSFLGNKVCYILFAGQDLKKLSKELLTFFDAYEGPHTIFLVTGPQDKLRTRAGVEHIEVEATVDANTYAKLYHADPKFVKKLFASVNTLELDQACLLMQYQLLLGKNSDQFFDAWLTRLIPQQHSLFTLSQYFFARDSKKFFAAWQKLEQIYPIEFWIPYWSEQLWQAIRFCVAVHDKGIISARQLQLKLPFSFMQKDWQKHKHTQIVTWYNRLYEIDFASKNGAISPLLDLWYAQCFTSPGKPS